MMSTNGPTKKGAIPWPDDRQLMDAAEEALVARLGVAGYVRYLALVGGGRDRFEDLRAAWSSTHPKELGDVL